MQYFHFCLIQNIKFFVTSSLTHCLLRSDFNFQIFGDITNIFLLLISSFIPLLTENIFNSFKFVNTFFYRPKYNVLFHVNLKATFTLPSSDRMFHKRQSCQSAGWCCSGCYVPVSSERSEESCQQWEVSTTMVCLSISLYYQFLL